MKNRTIAPASTVKVIFRNTETEQNEVVFPNRDVFSVISCLTSRLAGLESKGLLDDIKVSVHTMEDPEKSDPVPEGEERHEGPYGVAGIQIEDMSIPDALSTLTGGILPAEWCVKNIELLANELFVRSRMDGLFFIATFDGVPVASMLLNTLRDFNKNSIVSAYKAIKEQANGLRSWAENHFGDAISEEEWDSPLNVDQEEEKARQEAEERAERIVLPSGIPAKAAQEGIKTPEELRKEGPKVVHLY